MKISCPHCAQNLELDPETLASLQGQPHMACPTCEGLMAVPEAQAVRVPAKQTAARGPGKPAAEVAARAQSGMNRNLRVLGVVALLVLGAIAIFLASKNGGNIFNIFQNTTNQIIHNSYFTQLIADGVTTEEDLKAIAEIRPYGDGFIGVSKAALTWEQAQQAAKRMGADILAVDQVADTPSAKLIAWLGGTFASKPSSTAWVIEKQAPGVLVGTEILSVNGDGGVRKAFFQWRGNMADQNATVDLIALVDPERDMDAGVWRKIPEGLLLLRGSGVCRMRVAYVPPAEYDYFLEFSLVGDRIGHVSQQCVRDGQSVNLFVQHVNGPDVVSVLWMGAKGTNHPDTKVAQPLLKNGVRYRSRIEVRRQEIRAFLDDKLIGKWVDHLRSGPSPDPAKPVAFGAWDAGIIFHKAEIIPHTQSGDTHKATSHNKE